MERIGRRDEGSSRLGWVLFIAVIGVLLMAVVLSGCEDSPIGPDPAEKVSKTLTAVDGSENSIADAVFYNADTDERLDNPVEREKDSRLDIRAEASNYQSTTKTVEFTNDDAVTFSLDQENPETITITYQIIGEDGGSISNAEFTSADTLAIPGPSGSITVPYSKMAITVCGSADYYKQLCREIVPSDNHSITLALRRETVSITITPDIVGYSDIIRRLDQIPNTATDNTVYKVAIGDSIWVDKLEAHDNVAEFIFNPHITENLATTYTYPAGPNPIEASMRAVYVPEEGHAHSDNHYLNVAEGTIDLSGDSDSDVVLELAHIPACSDGVDNNFSGKADAEEPGCLDTWASTSIEPGTNGFVYEPEDDYESLSGFTATEGVYANSDYAVSGKEGKRESNFISSSNPLWEVVEVAVSVEARFTKLVSKDQSGEEFALEFRTGSSENDKDVVNITSIVADEDKEGWIEVILPLSRDYFSKGTYYGIKIIHATKLREEDPTDGNDDVVIFQKQRDDYFVISAIYEPELLSQEIAKKQQRKKIGDVEITDEVVNLK